MAGMRIDTGAAAARPVVVGGPVVGGAAGETVPRSLLRRGRGEVRERCADGRARSPRPRHRPGPARRRPRAPFAVVCGLPWSTPSGSGRSLRAAGKPSTQGHGHADPAQFWPARRRRATRTTVPAPTPAAAAPTTSSPVSSVPDVLPAPVSTPPFGIGMSPLGVLTTIVAMPIVVPPLSASVVKAPFNAASARLLDSVTVVPVSVAVPAGRVDHDRLEGGTVEVEQLHRLGATTLPFASTLPVSTAGSPGSMTKSEIVHLRVALGQREPAAVVLDLALDVRVHVTGLVDGDVAAGDRERRHAVLDRRLARGRRCDLQRAERLDEAGVQLDRRRMAGQIGDRCHRCGSVGERRAASQATQGQYRGTGQYQRRTSSCHGHP